MLGVNRARLKWLVANHQLVPVDGERGARVERLFRRVDVLKLRDQQLIPLADAALRLGKSSAELLRAARSAGLQHRRIVGQDGCLRYHVPVSFIEEYLVGEAAA